MRNLVFAMMACASLCGSAYAQQASDTYPSRVVKIVNPFAPGGQSDFASRIYAQKLGEELRVSFIVENRPGAGGNLGYVYLAKAAPDGYTIAYTSPAFTYLPFLSKEVPYDPVKDFSPIIVTTEVPYIFTVAASFPVKTFGQYLSLVKAHPKEFNFGTSGVGSLVHLSGAWIHGATNTQVLFIPYKGTGDVLAALVKGELQASTTAPVSSIPFIKTGKLRALAVTSTARLQQLPEVPTVAELNEQGLQGFSLTSWAGFVAPAGTPDAVIRKLNGEWAKILKKQEVIDKLEGATVVASTPEEFSQRIITEANRWRKVIQDVGITLQ